MPQAVLNSRRFSSAFTSHFTATSQPCEMQSASSTRLVATSAETFSPTIWLTTNCRARRCSRCFCCVTSCSRHCTASGLPARRRWCRLISSSSIRPSAVSARRRCAIDRHSIQRLLQKIPMPLPATLPKHICERLVLQRGIPVQRGTLSPRRIGIEKLPVISSVAIISLEFSNRSR